MNRLIAPAFLAGLLAVHPALGQEPLPRDFLTPRAIDELTLDELFARLSGGSGAPGGRAIEAEILERFHDSGSDTADLLLAWATQSMEEKNYPMALDLLDQVVMLKPDFAEGWNKRATVHYLLDDYASSLADIRQTLAIEPRHFGALSGLGLILEDMGQEERAIAAFRQALDINPRLDKIRESLQRLEKATAGNAI